MLALAAIGLPAAGYSQPNGNAMVSAGVDMNPELQSLATSMHFTAQDLEANRQGRLGDGQRRRLRWYVVEGGIALIVALVAVAGFFLVPREPKWYLGALAVAGLALYYGISSIELGRDLYAGRVAAISGRKEHTYGSNWGLSLTLGGVDFQIPRNYAPTLQDDRQYKLYYVPRSKTVVSAEPL
jgi:hypothetical protein